MSGTDSKRVRSIAILLPSLKLGGAERVALNLARAFIAEGMTVAILLMSREGEFLCEAEAEFTVVDLRCDRTWKLPQRLAQYLFSRPTDILLSSFWKLNLCACVTSLLFPALRLLLWEHSPPSQSEHSPNWLYAPSASLFYRRAQRVICVSGGVCDDIKRLTFGLGSRLIVIHNPIPPPALPNQAGLPRPRPQRIAWVGRLDHPKNPGLLIEAFALVADRIDAQIVYIGDGPMRPSLERRCIDLDLESRITFAGFQPSPYAILATSSLLTLTSDREGLGNVVIEAMHCGLGIVSTDCGLGVHEILLQGKYGTVVPARDPHALAAAIESELARPRDPVRQVQGASRFLPGVVVKKFLAA